MFNEIPKVEKNSEQHFDFENWLKIELPKQYEEKVKILRKLGLLEILPEAKDYGITGIDGQEYVLPEMEEIKETIKKDKEIFETKMKQGFTDLNIIPFGSPLEKLIKILEKTILKHHKEGKLFTAKKNLEDENEPLQKLELYADCDTNPEHSPLYVWEEGYEDADTENKIVYYPQEFSKNHQGQTKREMLNKTKRGFIVTLHEKNPNIPKENANEVINGRKRLEANKTSNDYLKMLQTEKQYQNEQGRIPEEWITKFLTILEKYNQVIDDYQCNGKASFQLGAYFLSSGDVPHCHWNRADRQAYLYRDDPRRQNGNNGAGSSARVL